MSAEPAVADIAHLIQLSVAPAFLLSGIGASLAVMFARSSRIVDRARVVEALLATGPDNAGPIAAEMRALEQRAQVISWAIGLCTLTALLVSAVIVVLFLSAFFAFKTATAVASLFIAAMLVFITALLLLLWEVLKGMGTLRFGPPKTANPNQRPPGQAIPGKTPPPAAARPPSAVPAVPAVPAGRWTGPVPPDR